MGSFNQKSEFRRPENLNKPIAKGEKFNVAELSLLRNFLGNNYAHVILTAEADSLPTDARQYMRTMAWWDATAAVAMTCHSAQDLIPHVMFVSCGNQVKKMTKIHMRRSLT